jgi:hypothetical protein
VTATADGRHPLAESSGPAEVGLSPGSVAGAGLAVGGPDGPVLPVPVPSLPELAGLTALELDESGLDDAPELAGAVLAGGGAVLAGGGLAGAVLAGGGLGLEDLGLGLAAGLAQGVEPGLAALAFAFADVEPGGLGLGLGLGTGAVLA